MGSFRDRINEKLKKELVIGNSLSRPLLSTGVDCFDYLNSTFYKNSEGEIVFEKGIKQGAIATFVGPSGSGKSTNALTCAIAILKQNADAALFIYDVEKSNSHKRCRQLIGCSLDEYNEKWKDKKIFIENTLTTTQGLQNLIDKEYEAKMEIGAGLKMTKEDGRYSAEAIKKTAEIREKAKDFPPTIIIVDSLAALAPLDYSGSKSSVGQRDGMANAQIAKANNALVKGSLEKCFEGNIMLFFVNHIQVLITTDMYGGDKRPLKFLKMDETLPGGKDAIFMSDFTLRLDQGKKIIPGKELDLKGFIQKVTLVKSRNNASGIDMEVVFDQYRGVNNVLTNYLLLKSNDKIGGGGQGFFLKSYPDVKFKQADLQELYNTNEDFRLTFDREACSIYEKLVLEMAKKPAEEEQYEEEDDDDTETTLEDVIAEIKACKGPKSLKKLCMDYGFEIPESVYAKDIAVAKKLVIRHVKTAYED
jgi:RecA/RadA recombinase